MKEMVFQFANEVHVFETHICLWKRTRGSRSFSLSIQTHLFWRELRRNGKLYKKFV